ncbi:MAG: alpha/beta fold hydrolase [Bacteroidales bacterium]|nr:alpha/beta fold hydrolase [Bacteroidales bacterium]
MKNFLKYLPLWLFVFAFCCPLQAQVPDLDTKYATEMLKPGTPAPDFTLQTPDGKTLQFSDFAKGKYVVIDFWASWCPDCRKDMPEVIRMYNKWHEMGVEFLGVSFDTDKQKWTDYIAQSGVPYPQVSELKRMNQSDVAKAYGVRWIPSLYLIGPDGKVLVSTVLSYKIENKLYKDFVESVALPFYGKYDTIAIDGSKGKLWARLYKPELKAEQRCDLVILCHGLNCDHDFSLMRRIAYYHYLENDFAVLEFDFNGHGKSEGKFVDMTIPNEMEDLEQVLAYAQDLRFVDDIALVGHSQGAVVAAMVAGKHPEDIKALVLLAPASSVRDDVVRGNLFGIDFDPLDMPDSLALNNGIALGYRYLKTASTLPIFETAANYHGNVCIIHGNADRLVPYTCSEHFHQIWTNSEYHLLNYYDHNFTVCPYRPAEITTEFLQRVMR